MKKLLFALVLVLVAGCQTWTPGGSPYKHEKLRFNVTAPQGWHFRQLNGKEGTTFVATREHPYLQQIAVEVLELKKELPSSKRTLSSDTSPLELAEALIDDHRSDKSLRNLKVIDQQPAEIKGRPGARYTIQWETEDGLVLRETLVAAIANGYIYRLTFTAPSRHYYDMEKDKFEKVVESFEIF